MASSSNSLVRAVTSADFQRTVLDASAERPVLVDVWAAWCGPCKALGPILDEVAAAREGVADLVKVDADAEGDLAAKYNVRALPTMLIFRHGKVVEQLVGLRSAVDILAKLDAVSASAA